MSETATKFNMYARDDSLPKLPLPSLQDTLRRLHQAATPFGEKRTVEEFVAAGVQCLADAQKILEQRHQTLPNWLGPWWDEFAYLSSRLPVAINTNIMAARLIDMNPVTWLPRPLFSDPAARAALCIRESVYFRSLMMAEVVREEIPGVTRPLCQNQFRRYYAMRVPKPNIDEVVSPQSPGETVYAVLMCKGLMCAIQLCKRNEPEALLSFRELVLVVRRAILEMQRLANDALPSELCDATLGGITVGALTAASRDDAARGFQLLADASEQNRQHLELLYRQTFTIVSVDDEPVNSADDALRISAVGNPTNRWYDRATSQIVASNGVASYQGEHSPMDAIVCATTPIEVVSRFANAFVLVRQQLPPNSSEENVRENFQPHEYYRRLDWVVPEETRSIILKAVTQHNAVAAHCEFCAFRCTSVYIGRDFFRKHRVSGDFAVQLAIQWAHYADSSGRFVAVYESASTRMFRHGRTDTIRSATGAVRRLLEALDSCGTDSRVWSEPAREDIRRRFLEAQTTHNQLSVEAATGKGIDRHLLGLRIAQGALQRPFPSAIDESEAVVRASSYLLLTSQMIGESYLGGFAHTMPEGYGVCYYILPSGIRASISCNNADGKTNAQRFARQLDKALLFIERFVSEAFPPKAATTKRASL